MPKKVAVNKEPVKKDILKKVIEMPEKEIVNKKMMKSTSAREGRNGMTRVSREEISEKINEAIDALGASKRSVSADKLRRAEEEIDKALRILLRAQREISTRRNWYISE
ncbi:MULTISPECIES: hypothetical protein [unclassified Paenibacillus]|uniref:hypothetical protein n=1 Tax=unclassified Paenibacillus TaxID=185978 RepID=UPI00070B130D|nr:MULTISPECIES: hypothetical protein [unclassified Paenibacillus]KQX46684.1 hypothetical protein ASD40_15410 [Paenibacillus sp. Root444D2]KRE34135.1 hypothetical protein ASG85_12200 [Paenibacillus sp. Soil724D2]